MTAEAITTKYVRSRIRNHEELTSRAVHRDVLQFECLWGCRVIECILNRTLRPPLGVLPLDPLTFQNVLPRSRIHCVANLPVKVIELVEPCLGERVIAGD